MSKDSKKKETHVREQMNSIYKNLGKQYSTIRNIVWMIRLREYMFEEIESKRNKYYYKKMFMEGHCSKEYMMFSFYVVSIAVCIDPGGVTYEELSRYYKGESGVLEEIRRFRNYVCHFNRIDSNATNAAVGHRELLDVENMEVLFRKIDLVADALLRVSQDRQDKIREKIEQQMETNSEVLNKLLVGSDKDDLFYISANAENDYILTGQWLGDLSKFKKLQK